MASRKITISNMDYIASIGTYGPIVTPTYFDEKKVYSLVIRNYDVTEYSDNPVTKGKTVKLTVHNFYDPKRFHDNTVKPVDTTNITGSPAAGRATAVNAVAPATPVGIPDVPEEKPAETPVEAKTIPINPGNNGKLSNKQRKELARKAAAERAAMNANTEKAVEEPVTDAVEATETTEVKEEPATESGPESLKD